jgi:hypothetical protein
MRLEYNSENIINCYHFTNQYNKRRKRIFWLILQGRISLPNSSGKNSKGPQNISQKKVPGNIKRKGHEKGLKSILTEISHKFCGRALYKSTLFQNSLSVKMPLLAKKKKIQMDYL